MKAKGTKIRSGSVIYPKVMYGTSFETGHNVVIRDDTTIGDDVLVGSFSIIEGDCNIGNRVRIQSNVFIPKFTIIESDVFIGPNVVMLNDKYPPGEPLCGPHIHKGARIGGHATILPGIRVGYNSFIAAGALVTKDVPDGMMAIGVPARIESMPAEMRR